MSLNDVPSQLDSPASTLSDEVRAFYERCPYPAPLTNLDRHVELYRNADRRRALHHLIWPAKSPAGRQEILVAGCGTSQGATIALREPESRVTAIDISETSLGYLGRLQQQYDIRNLDIRQLPIEHIEDLGRRFDLIVCTGVLHHLPDSDAGLRALRNVLDPEGAMHLMVYAAYGRAGIYMMQEYCRLLGVQASDRDLSDLASTIAQVSHDHPLVPVMRHAKDFCHADALADALLHPLDRAFTVPQVYDWLERCGMSFGRWFEQAPYSPACGVPATLPHAARLGRLSHRSQHAAVELFRGTMTQHNFIAYRDDYPGERQPVRFDVDHWREYVPIRLPWTVRVRDRMASGAVAVLINRAHGSADLALPIGAAEDAVLHAIDGRRTVDDVVRASAVESARPHALSFIERLWQHDQIVFDASTRRTA